MRPLSLAARRAVFAQQTEEVFLILLTITGTGLAVPLRFVNDSQQQVSRGSTYLPWPFQIALPDEREDAPPQVTLTIDNIDPAIIVGIRALEESPAVILEIVLASSPGTIEAGPFQFTLKAVDYDSLVIRGSLAFEDMLNEGYPCDSYDPTRFGGLFSA